MAELLSRSSVLPGDEARRETEILLCQALGKPRSYLFAWPEAEVPPQALHDFDTWLEQRRQGIPLAYLMGEREFWSLSLKIDDSTLIPRPETEILVEQALDLRLPGDAAVLDLGTGSGAIALALASERPRWKITAVERSAAALATARGNGERLGCTIRWEQGSWFEPVADRRFALIVSNPPYLAADDPHLQDGDLRYEPGAALVAGASGLEDLQHIVERAPGYLCDDAWLLLEHGCEQGEAVGAMLRARGFQEVRLVRDLAGLARVSVGRWQEGRADAQ